MQRRYILTLLASAFLPVRAAFAAAFPNRTVRLINQFGPGGGVDNIQRPLLERLSAELGVPVIIEFKPGASGAIAASVLETSSPDGHTLITDTQTLSLNSLLRSVPYKWAQWEPVAMLGVIPNSLLARKNFPADSIPALVAYAKANPGKVTYANLGPGSVGHLAALRLEAATGIELLGIPYKATMDVHQDLIGERVDFFFDGVSQALPRHKANQLKILGIATTARLANAPTIPTFQEQGVDLVMDTWFGICAPAGTTKESITVLTNAFVNAVSAPDYQERMRSLGVIPMPLRAEAFAKYRRDDQERWNTVIKKANIKIE